MGRAKNSSVNKTVSRLPDKHGVVETKLGLEERSVNQVLHNVHKMIVLPKYLDLEYYSKIIKDCDNPDNPMNLETAISLIQPSFYRSDEEELKWLGNGEYSGSEAILPAVIIFNNRGLRNRFLTDYDQTFSQDALPFQDIRDRLSKAGFKQEQRRMLFDQAGFPYPTRARLQYIRGSTSGRQRVINAYHSLAADLMIEGELSDLNPPEFQTEIHNIVDQIIQQKVNQMKSIAVDVLINC